MWGGGAVHWDGAEGGRGERGLWGNGLLCGGGWTARGAEVGGSAEWWVCGRMGGMRWDWRGRVAETGWWGSATLRFSYVDDILDGRVGRRNGLLVSCHVPDDYEAF